MYGDKSKTMRHSEIVKVKVAYKLKDQFGHEFEMQVSAAVYFGNPAQVENRAPTETDTEDDVVYLSACWIDYRTMENLTINYTSLPEEMQEKIRELILTEAYSKASETKEFVN